ncbi:MAG: diadenylate cyclase CdaA, partial [Syntrophomonadaceae bacterium]|nr:diadenylate cyclase CdaA [Syntrophomonadaceae bacterium]
MDFSAFSGLFANPTRVALAALDILIVAYVLYRALLLIRGTRAEQLLKGLLTLLVLSIGARYLRLEVVGWVMDRVWTMVFIALPVVFQPELRRGLEQLGRGSFFAHPSERWTDTGRILNDLVQAAGTLSRAQTGALIVIERETGIQDFIESGIKLDAVVSPQLLVNLFMPKSPLHDGAVIISRGRITGAGCFLPLSDNPRLDRSLGTRHRAAVGITEVSDALAVVVSEETGAISLARGGQISRCA